MELNRLILADCPWSFADRKLTRKDNPSKKTKFGIGADRRYSLGTMPTRDVCALGPLVQASCTDDAYLALWVVRSMIEDALAVLDAWGFHYCTELLTWVKTTKNGLLVKNPGAYSLQNTEALWLARRCNSKGRMKRMWHNNKKGCYKPPQVIMEPRPVDEHGKIIHSRKPEVFHEVLETWLDPYLGECGKMELFATQSRPGWTCLGHELSGNSIDLDLENLYGKQQ